GGERLGSRRCRARSAPGAPLLPADLSCAWPAVPVASQRGCRQTPPWLQALLCRACTGAHPGLIISSCRRPEEGTGGSTAPSASTSWTSGATSKMAFSIASLSVIEDDGQPEQLPSRRRCATPSSTPSSSALPPWDSI